MIVMVWNHNRTRTLVQSPTHRKDFKANIKDYEKCKGALHQAQDALTQDFGQNF